MIGVFVNTATVIIGSAIGLLFKKGISKRFTDAIMIGIGLCTIYIGISGALKGENTLILIVSIVVGAVIGTWLDIDGRINALGDWIGKRFKKADSGNVSIAEGFVTASLLFCIGALTIVGSLNAGLTGDNEMLFTKSLLDLISSAILSVSLGIGVMFAAAFVLIFQGSIVLLAQSLQPVLTDSVIAEITCAGSVMIIALGLNLIGLAKIKVANYLPAIFVAPVICWILTLF
ncbi:MAG: DUF554 domain-containing protein [Bacillota bacterium]|jgi:uncharacterized membrane protein YqgA involved in biofilm formation|nr:DUF554 domain-containing protein [Bacillota bacterium]NLM09125.1 DUF554 domain-containing protein [Clostridiales Family XIII bacterium]